MFLNLLFLPLIGFLSIIFFGRFVTRYFIVQLNLFCLLISICFTVVLINDVVVNDSVTTINMGYWIKVGAFIVPWQLLFDPLSLIMVFLVLIISALVHFYSWEYMGEDPHFLRFLSYLSIFTFFMLLFVTSGNFLQMFFGWEGVGLSSYLLINFWFTRLQANKSAMKAIIVNRISDLFLYFSIFVLFFIFGTLDYLTIFTVVGISEISVFWLTLICFCLFMGAVGKSAQLGLHTWLPDAMEGPTPVSALLHAATMVTAGVFLLVRCSILLELVSFVLLLILFIGGLTTFVAGSIGCFQNDIKKIIAYSTCSQLGYMFLVLGLGYFDVSFFHLFNHAFFKALLFLGSGSVIHSLLDEQDIRRMGGLFASLPVTYISFFIASLALAGIPYLSGFYSKDLLIELTYTTYTFTSVFSYWLALFSVFFTAFYSTRILYYVFWGWPNYVTFRLMESGNTILLVLGILSVSSIFIGYLSRDFLIGMGTSVWQNSVAILKANHFIETELSFIFAGWLATNKLFPLLVTLSGVIVSFFVLFVWLNLVSHYTFRLLYIFINQKWFYDLIYFNFIISILISLAYNVMFKLIDRGLLEFMGSMGVSTSLNKLYATNRFIFETGNLYSYLTIQIVLLGTFLLSNL